MENKIYQCIIIGGGPCGVGAAEVLKAANVDFAVVEFSMPGGKVNIAPRVDNYPNEYQISGPDLAMKFAMRLMALKAPLITKEVVSLEKENELFKITLKNQTILLAKTVLIATGGKERKLGLEKENELLGHGISYCAICDGHFFKQKDIVVVADNEHALSEANYLANLANKLYLIIKSDLKINQKYTESLFKRGNVEVIYDLKVTRIYGEDKVSGVMLDNSRNINCDALFPLIGQDPNTSFINIKEVLDEKGAVKVNKEFESICFGLFAGGDVLPREIKQIYLSEHDGKQAAKSILNRLGVKYGA